MGADPLRDLDSSPAEPYHWLLFLPDSDCESRKRRDMGREQDLLFCQIAISTKKVSQEAAQKCLALANRFEAEGKRRPQVGEIFLKNNLLTDQDVLRINGAVQKRMEAQGAAEPAPAPAARTPAPAQPAGAARQPARAAV